MGLDIRLPLGLIFLITGLIMLIYGAATHGSAMYSVSMGININVIWGGFMALFGLTMIFFARRRRRHAAAPGPSAL